MSLRTLAVIGGILVLLLLITLGWEAERGRKLRQSLPEPVAIAKPLEITLAPEFQGGTLQTRKETTERPLFVPTRRPTPAADAEKEPSKIERGLFVLSGTAIQGQTRIAFLRNAKDNKPKTVYIGDVVEGMSVSVITADKVVLTAGGQEEELLLKATTGPKGAVTPATLPQQPQSPQQQTQPQQPQSRQYLQQPQQQPVQPVAGVPSSSSAQPETAPASAGNPAESNQRRSRVSKFGP